MPKTVDCCPPLLTATINEAEAVDAATMFKLLSDPIRLRLLNTIANAPTGEACVCELTEPLGRSQPTISHHLSVLAGAGLLQREQRGRWAYYRINHDRFTQLRTAFT